LQLHWHLPIWATTDLAKFKKNGWIPDLPEPESKSGATLFTSHYTK